MTIRQMLRSMGLMEEQEEFQRAARAYHVYFELGHGPTAYENPNYSVLVRRAILWAAGKQL